jgi:hypothetical protein
MGLRPKPQGFNALRARMLATLWGDKPPSVKHRKTNWSACCKTAEDLFELYSCDLPLSEVDGRHRTGRRSLECDSELMVQGAGALRLFPQLLSYAAADVFKRHYPTTSVSCAALDKPVSYEVPCGLPCLNDPLVLFDVCAISRRLEVLSNTCLSRYRWVYGIERATREKATF